MVVDFSVLRRRRGATAGAIAAGAAAAAALAGVGWYAGHAHGGPGLAQLTPGSAPPAQPRPVATDADAGQRGTALP